MKQQTSAPRLAGPEARETPKYKLDGCKEDLTRESRRQGVALEPKSGEDAVVVFTWDEICSVSLAKDAGTAATHLAEVFEQ